MNGVIRLIHSKIFRETRIVSYNNFKILRYIINNIQSTKRILFYLKSHLCYGDEEHTYCY